MFFLILLPKCSKYLILQTLHQSGHIWPLSPPPPPSARPLRPLRASCWLPHQPNQLEQLQEFRKPWPETSEMSQFVWEANPLHQRCLQNRFKPESSKLVVWMNEYYMPPPGPEHVLFLLTKPKGWSERILQDSPLPECPPFSIPGGHTHPLGSTEEVYNRLYSEVHSFNGRDINFCLHPR